jgi:hypothetical protein
MEQELIDYIIQAEHHGLTEFEIKQNLLNAGWDAVTVEKNFVLAKASENAPTSAFTESTSDLTRRHFTNSTNHIFEANSHSKTLETLDSEKNFSVNEPSQIVTTKPNLVISEETFVNTGTKSVNKTALWLLAGLILLAISASAFAYYKFVYVNPDKIWSEFIKQPNPKIFRSDFNVNYTAAGKLKDPNPVFGDLNNIGLNFSGTSYFNNSENESPQSESKITYTFTNNEAVFSTVFEYILLNKTFYLKAGKNSITNLLFGSAPAGQSNTDWVKFQTNISTSTQVTDQKSILQPFNNIDLQTEIQKIWKDSNVIKNSGFLGKEEMSGQTVLHFQNTLDMEKLKVLLLKSVEQLALNYPNQLPEKDAQLLKDSLVQLVDKFSVQKFETWIGKNDLNLYKIKLDTNFPSFIEFANKLNELYAKKTNDQIKLDDIRELGAKLEIYYNDQKGYPEALNGIPVGLEPNYILKIPTAPKPEGECTDYFNSYWYKTAGTKKIVAGKTVYSSYQITFCLGADTSIYKAGIGKLTPQGMYTAITCPATEELCVNKNPPDPYVEFKNKIHDFINNLNYEATLKIEASFSDFGQKHEIQLPEGI